MDKPCLMELHAREKAGLPDNWLVYRWEAFPKVCPTLYYEVTGVVTTVTYKSGPRKGRTNYSKGDESTRRTVVLPTNEHEEFRQTWSRETGKCLNCLGTGKEWRGWSEGDGNRYRECPKCGGSGSNNKENSK